MKILKDGMVLEDLDLKVGEAFIIMDGIKPRKYK